MQIEGTPGQFSEQLGGSDTLPDGGLIGTHTRERWSPRMCTNAILTWFHPKREWLQTSGGPLSDPHGNGFGKIRMVTAHDTPGKDHHCRRHAASFITNRRGNLQPVQASGPAYPFQDYPATAVHRGHFFIPKSNRVGPNGLVMRRGHNSAAVPVHKGIVVEIIVTNP